MFLVQNKYKNTLVGVLGIKINFRYALITFVLRYTPHSGYKALTQVIRVLRKPTRVFFYYCIVISVLYPLDIPSIKKATEYHNN